MWPRLRRVVPGLGRFTWLWRRARPLWMRRRRVFLTGVTFFLLILVFHGGNKDQDMASRRLRVEDVCRRKGVDPTMSLDSKELKNIYVEDRHGLLYCSVPRAACTNFKRVLLVLTGKTATQDPEELPASDVHSGPVSLNLKTLDQFSPEEIEYRLRNYMKFMFVRNPLERLLSAYTNKFTLKYNTYFRKTYGTTIIKKYRKNPTKEALDNGHDVTFEEFMQYLTDSSIKQPTNPQWSQYYRLCHPCLVHYDVIGNFETFDEDVEYLMRKAGVSHLKFPRPNRVARLPKTTEVFREAFTKLRSETVHRLWEMFSVDFAMFGYQYPDFGIPMADLVNRTTTSTPKPTAKTTKTTAKPKTSPTPKPAGKPTPKTTQKPKPKPTVKAPPKTKAKR